MTDIDGIIERFQKPALLGKEAIWDSQRVLDLLNGRGRDKTGGRAELAKQMTDLNNTFIQIDKAELEDDLPDSQKVDNLRDSELKDEIEDLFKKKKEELGIKSDLEALSKGEKKEFTDIDNFRKRIRLVKNTKKIGKFLSKVTSKELREIIIKRENEIGPVNTSFFTRLLRETESDVEMDRIIQDAKEKGLAEIGLSTLRKIKEARLETLTNP